MWPLALLCPRVPPGGTFNGQAVAAVSGQRKQDSTLKKITCPCGFVLVFFYAGGHLYLEKVKSCVLISENKAALNNLLTNACSSVD